MRNRTTWLAAGLIAATGIASAQSTGMGPTLNLEDALQYGKTLYMETAVCFACHGNQAEGGAIGPALTHEMIPPSAILYQLETNPKMSDVPAMLEPLDPTKLYALSVYLNRLAGIENTQELTTELFANATAALNARKAAAAGLAPTVKLKTWDDVVVNWERKAKTGPLKADYEMRVLQEFDAEQPVFTPEPGKTYWYEATGLAVDVLAPTKGGDWATTSQLVVGDAETKEIVANHFMPEELRGEVHTTFASPDGRYIYMVSSKAGAESDLNDMAALMSPAGLLKVDALTLNPVKNMDMGGRLHHGQIFQDRYLLVDTFVSDPDGLDVFLMDPETDKILGGVRGEDLGGVAYTAWTDDEFIYVLMAPPGYGPAGGFMEGAHYALARIVESRTFWIAKLDPENWEVLQEIPYPGLRGDWITFDSNNEYIYVTAGSSSMVSKIRLETGERIWTQATGPGPYGATLNADETELWVADKGETVGFLGRTMTIVDAESGRLLETLFSGYMVDHVLLSPDGKEMWASANGEGRIYVWDAETRKQKKIIEMPKKGDPHGLVWVHYDDQGSSAVVRDQGGFHNGIDPRKGKPLN